MEAIPLTPIFPTAQPPPHPPMEGLAFQFSVPTLPHTPVCPVHVTWARNLDSSSHTCSPPFPPPHNPLAPRATVGMATLPTARTWPRGSQPHPGPPCHRLFPSPLGPPECLLGVCLAEHWGQPILLFLFMKQTPHPTLRGSRKQKPSRSGDHRAVLSFTFHYKLASGSFESLEPKRN